MCFGKWTTTTHPNPLLARYRKRNSTKRSRVHSEKKNRRIWKHARCTHDNLQRNDILHKAQEREWQTRREKEEKDRKDFHILMKGEVVLSQGWSSRKWSTVTYLKMGMKASGKLHDVSSLPRIMLVVLNAMPALLTLLPLYLSLCLSLLHSFGQYLHARGALEAHHCPPLSQSLRHYSQMNFIPN